MLYNCIVQSGTVREKLPLVQSLSVVGGWGGEGCQNFTFRKLHLAFQPGPFFQIFSELTKQKIRFHLKIKKINVSLKKDSKMSEGIGERK